MAALPASAYPSQAAIDRVLKAAKKHFKLVGFRVEPGGAIVVFDKSEAPPLPPRDGLEAWLNQE